MCITPKMTGAKVRGIGGGVPTPRKAGSRVGNIDSVPTMNRAQAKPYSTRDVNRAKNEYSKLVDGGNAKKAKAKKAEIWKKYRIKVD